MTKIKDETGQLVYAKYGEGAMPLITFHGFGQDKEHFESWSQHLGTRYTIYAFDLFYHGESTRDYGKLSKKEWATFFNSFLVKEAIEQFHVLGYSLGGRFALATALNFEQHVNKLILVAPDGVFLTIWFKLATRPTTKWLFKYLMLNPDKLDSLVQFNEKRKIVSPYLGNFVRKEMGKTENRKRVYISWNHFKHLGYSKKKLIRRLQKAPFEKRIVLGNKDHIIRPENILPIIHKIGGFKVDILDKKHHQLIDQEVAELLRKD